MSPATVAIAVEGVLLALALLFVVALLRSHAQILRRLGALEGEPGAAAPIARGRPGQAPAPGPVADIAGQSLAGDAVKIALGPGSPATLLCMRNSRTPPGAAAAISPWPSRSTTARLWRHRV